jgi:hypothetical protein
MISRRSFLQGVTAAIASVQLPLSGPERAVEVTNKAGKFEFFGPKFFDFNFQIGVMLKLPDGRRIAVRTLHRKNLVQEEVRELKNQLLARAERILLNKDRVQASRIAKASLAEEAEQL